MPAGDHPPTVLSEAFDRTVEALASAGASYALIGGFAVAFHGLPRPTRDIDLLLSVPRVALPGLLERFLEQGFTVQPEEVIRELEKYHLSKIDYGGIRVDLLDAVIPLFRRTVQGAREQVVRGRRVRIASAEDLIALKMIPARDDDLRDVRGILATQGGGLDLEAVRRSLAECCSEDRIEAFERLVREMTK
jgi:predicted nucleotidyltransferase